jgi:hypothetical protein
MLGRDPEEGGGGGGRGGGGWGVGFAVECMGTWPMTPTPPSHAVGGVV